MSVRLTVAVSGQERLNRQLDAFRKDVRARQKHARKLGGYVRTDAKRNIRNQRSFEGASFAPRKDARRKRRMLQGLHDDMKVISKAQEGGGVIVSWPNAFEAGIAGRHQWGLGEEWNPKRMAASRGKPDYRAPCTRKQAKALIREGYRAPRKGKPPQRVTVRQLEERFSLGQAGVILRMLRTGSARGKQSWVDTVPARPFLGVTPAQAEKHCEKLAKAIAKAAAKAGR